MKRTSLPDPPGFQKLTKTEQIGYLQSLWDRITENPGEIPAPERHIELAEQRLSDHRRDPRWARPAHEVLDRLFKKPRRPIIGS